jgi:hypothetical protein
MLGNFVIGLLNTAELYTTDIFLPTSYLQLLSYSTHQTSPLQLLYFTHREALYHPSQPHRYGHDSGRTKIKYLEYPHSVIYFMPINIASSNYMATR